MKKTVLVLLALFALVPLAAMAQTPSPAPAPDAATARFLATLAAPQPQTPNGLTPAPLFETDCGNGPACPTGELCCFLCGNPPADGDLSGCYGCVTPYKGRCPMVV
jgi:hypothetical protein